MAVFSTDWYATCSYAGKSFSAYVGKQRDEARALALLRGKVRAWLREREQTDRNGLETWLRTHHEALGCLPARACPTGDVVRCEWTRGVR